MKNRIIVGGIFSILMILALGFSYYYPEFFYFFLTVLAFLFAFEISRTVKNFWPENSDDLEFKFVNKFLFSLPSIVSLLLALSLLIGKFSLLFPTIFRLMLLIFFIIPLVGGLFFKARKHLREYASVLVLQAYILLPLVAAFEFSTQYKRGFFLFCYSLFVSWFTDTFAYFFGYFWGKTKIIPEISPKKTWAGFYGGILGSFVCSILAYYFFYQEISIFIFIFMGIFAGIFAQFGDWTASLIKRSLKIKDFSSILASHGGLIDRFDGVFFNWLLIWLIFGVVETLG